MLKRVQISPFVALLTVVLLFSGGCSNTSESTNAGADTTNTSTTSAPDAKPSSEPEPTTTSHDDSKSKKTLFCSTTQVADFARNVVGDDWNVVCVLGPGQDPHSYRPGTDDAFAAGKADLCLENGWHLEGNEWMKTLAKNANKPIVTCVNGIKHLEMDDEGKTV